MHETPFADVIRQIYEKDKRFDPEAYFFVREGLDFTAKTMNKPHEGPGRHMTGRELLEGLRQYAIQEFGPMAMRVLTTWGLRRTEDFGEIVFNLVESGKLGKTEEDRKEDFQNVYDFDEVFVRPFKPASAARWVAGIGRKSSVKRKTTPRKQGGNKT